ncbi:PLP-dependent transferase [Parathielavia appendiculata]|uniref:PLP-dependent transferase n=1 Tax=Parathielavia appendiculata TaxID=2587402 RepID=A0AAN6Z359_9PEZI|nr:PLP-dependent transferase [Parathielavia appendiculata]
MARPSATAPTTDTEADFLLEAYTNLRHAVATTSSNTPILPSPTTLASTLSSLPNPDSPSYLLPLGPSATHAHLLQHILPALNHQSLSPRYLGFVTGGVLPIAEAADNLVSALDQNVQVHFPSSLPPPSSSSDPENPNPAWTHSASTAIEDAALRMLISLLQLDTQTATRGSSSGEEAGVVTDWPGRTFTTGATASNILGLACGREAVVNWRLAAAAAADGGGGGVGAGQVANKKIMTVAETGLLAAVHAAGIKSIQVLTSMGHSSVSKAASVLGLGHTSVKEVGAVREGEPWRLDLDLVERELARAEGEGVVSIVVVSAGEVNTGRFATNVLDMPKLRSLADRYGAWIHVDGAFGLFARALPKTDEFLSLHAHVAGLELADSIAADGHKLLNVPYDNGVFLCRDASILTQVFSNPNAAYLASPGDSNAILSPLNVGIENSRRFRALPVYAVLLSEGREGIAAMLRRMVLLAREIAAFVRDSEHYEWLPSEAASLESTYIVVLFRAKSPALNEVLADRINATGKIFVSGTKWDGRKAVRIAVGSWRADVERDAAVIKEVLTEVAEGQ